MRAARAITAEVLGQQAIACAQLGSTLYADLLSHSARDVEVNGPVWEVLRPHAADDRGSALALRLMAAAHRMVLTRRAADLALHYPSVGGTPGVEGAWPAFLRLCADQTAELSALVALPCQTNEVNRCAALLPGFLTVAGMTGLPLRTLEIGASAGLNLRWDRYRYEGPAAGAADPGHDAVDASGATAAWGDAASPVRLGGDWQVPAAILAAPTVVAARAGCDLQPVDADTEAGRLALTSSVWADQSFRLERLRAALVLATEDPPEVAAVPVRDWLPAQLAEPTPGRATVVYHSVVYQYLTGADRATLHDGLAAAGAVATADAPVAWLHMEPVHVTRGMLVHLSVWRGREPEHQLVAEVGAHGDPVRWHGTPLAGVPPLLHGEGFRR